MRYATLLLAVVVGCTEKSDLQPFVAASGAYSLLDVEPAPVPKPDVCENCGGSGVVVIRYRSTGPQMWTPAVSVPCPVCRPGSVAAPKPPTCESGKCPTPVTRR